MWQRFKKELHASDTYSSLVDMWEAEDYGGDIGRDVKISIRNNELRYLDCVALIVVSPLKHCGICGLLSARRLQRTTGRCSV